MRKNHVIQSKEPAKEVQEGHAIQTDDDVVVVVAVEVKEAKTKLKLKNKVENILLILSYCLIYPPTPFSVLSLYHVDKI